ncbi:hypothetical protein P7L78_26080 [Tistrella bauzanensis]|uniref:hypothetical protein n=1 Tax=Tistrella TaxID=171436 RepID=UPI0031F696E4
MTIRVIDVTLRDGGYVNDHRFTPSQASALVAGLAASGLDYIEVGYYRPQDEALYDGRPAACCPAWYLEQMRRVSGAAGLTVMAHVHQVGLDDYARLADQGVRLVRMPATPARIDAALVHAERIRSLGMDAAINLIRASEQPLDLAPDVARRSRDAGVTWFYIADSNGGLYPHEVARRIGDIVAAVPAHGGGGAGMGIGFHAHDGLRLGFANTLAALDAGVTIVDGSLGGMGKGGGNCQTEALAVYMHRSTGRPYDHQTLAGLIRDHLHDWVDPRSSALYENCLAAALNLNLDDLRALRDEQIRNGTSFLTLLADRLSAQHPVEADLAVRGAA